MLDVNQLLKAVSAQKDHNVKIGNIYSIAVKKQYLLKSAAAALGSSIKVTPVEIRHLSNSWGGPQAIEISAAGITLMNSQGASARMFGPSATPKRLW